VKALNEKKSWLRPIAIRPEESGPRGGGASVPVPLESPRNVMQIPTCAGPLPPWPSPCAAAILPLFPSAGVLAQNEPPKVLEGTGISFNLAFDQCLAGPR